MATASRAGLGGYGRGKPMNPKLSKPGKAEDIDDYEIENVTKNGKVAKGRKEKLDFEGNRIEIEAQKLTRRGMFGTEGGFDEVRLFDTRKARYFEGRFSYFENPNYFCVQSYSMQGWLRKNEHKFHAEIEEEEEDLRMNPEINYADMACAVDYNGSWRRGYVMRTNWVMWPDNAHKYIAEVNLVDSGYYGFERLANLRELPDKWKRVPPMAYRVCLDGDDFFNREDRWSPSIIKKFHSFFPDKTLDSQFQFRSWEYGAVHLNVFSKEHWCGNCKKTKAGQCSVNELMIRYFDEARRNWKIPEELLENGGQ